VEFELTAEPVTEAELPARILELASVHFDVTAEIPFRASLLKVTRAGAPNRNGDRRRQLPDEHVVVLVMHHISGDGFSLRPLLRDVVAAYSERSRGEAPAWTPLPVQYADYALWQHEVLGAPEDSASAASRQIAYWSEQLRDLPEQIDLPADRPRPEVATNSGGTHNFSIDAELHGALTELARAHGVTLFMLMHAVLATWAARLSGSRDIAIGTPIAGRGERALDDMVGMFVNTLVLRTDVRPDARFAELLDAVRRTDLAAFGHADVPFEHLVDVLSPVRSQAHHPLFQVVLTFEATGQRDAAAVSLPGLDLEVVEFDAATAKFDIQLTVGEAVPEDPATAAGGLSLSWNYATDLFDPATVAAFSDRLLRILHAVVEDPATVLGDIDLLGEAERLDVTNRWVSSGAEDSATARSASRSIESRSVGALSARVR